MCTSIVVNKRKTIVGWNLDILDMEYRIRTSYAGVFIEINDAKEGWLPLFGANARGDFVGMPTCHPFDARSDPAGNGENIIRLDIDLLLQMKTLPEIRDIADNRPVFSIPGVTFMGALSDAAGNVLHIVPGQGSLYYEKPVYKVLTNFSPFKQDSEKHPWMGWDRYKKADAMLKEAADDFDMEDCFAVLRAASQEVCPTVVSMVFDVQERKVYWAENREWDLIRSYDFISEAGLSFTRSSVVSPDAQDLLQELNETLTGILGHNGTAHVCLDDFSHQKAFFLVGYDQKEPVC